MVLEMYPLMRRTMESIAAERLNKIGKQNPQLPQKPSPQVSATAPFIALNTDERILGPRSHMPAGQTTS